MATSRANNLPDFEIQTRGRAMPIEGETLGDSADAFVGVCPEVVTLIDDSNASSQALCPDANAQAGGAPSPIAFEHPSGDAGAFGKFRLGAELGRGGMGIVYRAFDTIVRREVALKLLASNQSQQVRTRFLLEAEAAGRLVHPHVCRVYECGEVEGRLFISMELVDGCPADEHVREEGLSVRQIGRLTARICNAIGFAHGEGVVHRDLKPHNILVDRRMATPKIMDFGIARVQGAGRAPQTAAGTVLGTPAYMSPEQALGTSDLGPTTDVWSLGVLLYKLLAGNLPFEGATFPEMLARISSEEPAPLIDLNPDVDVQLAAVVERALRKDPADRYSDARPMAKALWDWIDARSSGNRPAYKSTMPLRRAAKPPLLRQPHFLSAGIGFLLGMTAGIALTWLLLVWA